MANWRSSGSAVRRREGAPASHMDSLGAPVPRVSLTTPEEALAGMARVGSGRIPMGTSAITDFANANAVPPLRGELVPKTGNIKTGDPYIIPGLQVRSNVVWGSERSGASYRVKAIMSPTIDPAATATQANGRIIPSVINRSGSWADGVDGAYAGY